MAYMFALSDFHGFHGFYNEGDRLWGIGSGVKIDVDINFDIDMHVYEKIDVDIDIDIDIDMQGSWDTEWKKKMSRARGWMRGGLGNCRPCCGMGTCTSKQKERMMMNDGFLCYPILRHGANLEQKERVLRKTHHTSHM